MGLVLNTYEFYDNSGGLDLQSSPTKTAEDDATSSLNVDYQIDGAVFTRNGSTILNSVAGVPTPMDQLRTLGFYDYRKSDGTSTQVLQAGSKIYHSLTTPTAQVTGLNSSAIPDFEFQVTNDDEWLIWGNGIDANKKFNGTTWTDLSIAQPANPTVGLNGAGTLTGDFEYYVQFQRQVAGVVVQVSDLNPVAQAITGAANIIRITRPASPDAQVTHWTIFRLSPTSGGLYYQIVDPSAVPVTIPIATTIYDDDNVTDGTIEAEFDNQAAPLSAVFEEYMGYILYASGPNLYPSKRHKPWNVPEDGYTIYDGGINGVSKAYGAVLISTSNGTLWVLDGDPTTTEPRQISTKIGFLNNRCCVGEGTKYTLASNRKFYSISPTDFSQKEIRIDEPLSIRIQNLIAQVGASLSDLVNLEYYTSPSVSKVMISVPIITSTNNSIIIFNETQSVVKKKPVWHYWNNINASAMKLFNIGGELTLVSGDFAGYIWHLDDNSLFGDGAEINGTATSGSTTTINDLTQSWTVNAYRGMTVTAIGGTGDGLSATITSNTATQLVFSAVSTAFDSTTEYTIGGYDNYHYTNWKSVTGSYDTLKQLWYFISNLNASGSYAIDLIIQYDFDTTITNQIVLNVTLQSTNTIWNSFIWGAANWGSQSVFQDRIRLFSRFRAVRFAFRSRAAGQPFQVNGFSVSVQDKGLFYGSS